MVNKEEFMKEPTSEKLSRLRKDKVMEIGKKIRIGNQSNHEKSRKSKAYH